MKLRLANRLIYSPFLRLLLFKFWFRLAFLGFVLLVVLLALFLPKIWTVSERGTLPIIKVSGLDLVQAWSLKRTARSEMAAGRTDRANYAWLGAMGNNPTDVEALRGFLRNLVVAPPTSPEALRIGLGQSSRLLRLTRTNAVDVELVTDLLRKYHYDELALALLAPMADRLNPNEQSSYLKVLFRLGHLPEFTARWKQFGAEQLPDPELRLYWAAYLSGWSPDKADQGKQELNASLANPQNARLANRLQLLVSARKMDLPSYRAALKSLQDRHEDEPGDHVAYWALLKAAGRADQARQLALAYVEPPPSARAGCTVAAGLDLLELHDPARQLYRKLIAEFPESEEVWIRYAESLAATSQWQELSRLAVQMRAEVRLEQDLIGYAYLMETRAEAKLQRHATADAAARKVAQLWTGHPNLAQSSADVLIGLGYPDVARDLLVRFEPELGGTIEYWRTLFKAAAAEHRDPALLLKAAEKETELEPQTTTALNHYAAALLINRVKPEAAIKATVTLLSAFPESLTARINHSFALLMNHRVEDARSILGKIRASSLTAEQATSYYLALFEACYRTGDYEEAWKAYDHIDSKFLFPSDQTRLEEWKNKLPVRNRPKLSQKRFRKGGVSHVA